MNGFDGRWRAASLALLAALPASCATPSPDEACAREAAKELGITDIQIKPRALGPNEVGYVATRLVWASGYEFGCWVKRDGTVSVAPFPPPNP